MYVYVYRGESVWQLNTLDGLVRSLACAPANRVSSNMCTSAIRITFQLIMAIPERKKVLRTVDLDYPDDPVMGYNIWYDLYQGVLAITAHPVCQNLFAVKKADGDFGMTAVSDGAQPTSSFSSLRLFQACCTSITAIYTTFTTPRS